MLMVGVQTIGQYAYDKYGDKEIKMDKFEPASFLAALF